MFKKKSKTNVTDMTVGSPTKHILLFAIPLLIGNIFQQFYSMVDSIVVGNYVGANALAAVGNCGSLNFLFFSLSSGLAIGIGVLVSQHYGAKDDKNVRVTIANSFYIVFVAAAIVSVVGFILGPWILKLLNTPDTILQDSTTYLRVTCLGIVAVALYNSVASMLRALGDSKTPLYFLIFASFVNVGLDLLFVLVFHLGVLGVALATIISQAVSAILCLIYAIKKVSYFQFHKDEWKYNQEVVVKTVKIGVPIAMQSSMIAISCMALQGVVNQFGEVIMAASTVVSRIEMVVQQPYGSLSSAVTTYSGQNMGAGKMDRVQKGFKRATLIALIFSILLIPIMYGFGEQIMGIFVKDPDVIAVGKNALRITSLFYFALGMIYVPRAVLNGCGDAKFPMINGITEVLCRISYSQIFTKIPVIGYWGIWITTCATWITTAAVCLIHYKRGKWKEKRIRA